jgi:osmotically inducible protein OsmC
MNRKGSAVWKGGLKDGQGTVSTPSGVLKETPYSFRARFEDGSGTNPEELIAAAHAGCFSMALSLFLAEKGLTADEIRTTATVSLEQVGGGFSITKVHLDLTAKIPGADETAFQEAAKGAKENCPVSKLFNAEITLDAKLEA